MRGEAPERWGEGAGRAAQRETWSRLPADSSRSGRRTALCLLAGHACMPHTVCASMRACTRRRARFYAARAPTPHRPAPGARRCASVPAVRRSHQISNLMFSSGIVFVRKAAPTVDAWGEGRGHGERARKEVRPRPKAGGAGCLPPRTTRPARHCNHPCITQRTW
jgi:hypothetical protein